MNTSEAHAVHRPWPEAILNGVSGGTMTEGIGAISALVLAVIALAGILPDVLASVATIVMGAVIFMKGGLASRRLQLQGAGEGQSFVTAGNATAEFFGGLAGIVLGILALFRAMPAPLLAVALLVYGATLLLGGGFAPHGNGATLTQNQGAPHEAVAPDCSGVLLVGLSTAVLGILAIIGLVPMTLILVGLLSLGAAALFDRSAVSNGATQPQ